MTTPSGAEIFDFAAGAGGRIFDLPRSYQDRVAEVVRKLHPKTVTRQVQRVMASEGYLGSSHPLIRDLDGDRLRDVHRRLSRKVVTDGAG